MGLAARDIQEAALNLNSEQRAKLAALLIESLEPDGAPVDPGNEDLWFAEAEERARQIDAGRVELVPADEVINKLRGRDR
jgi:hypothetical protein